MPLPTSDCFPPTDPRQGPREASSVRRRWGTPAAHPAAEHASDRQGERGDRRQGDADRRGHRRVGEGHQVVARRQLHLLDDPGLEHRDPVGRSAGQRLHGGAPATGKGDAAVEGHRRGGPDGDLLAAVTLGWARTNARVLARRSRPRPAPRRGVPEDAEGAEGARVHPVDAVDAVLQRAVE